MDDFIGKPCCYCHKRPRRDYDPYCSDRCKKAKQTINHRHTKNRNETQREWRKQQRDQEAAEWKRIYQHSEYMKRKARAVLRANDDPEPHHLRPAETVTMWNIRTGETEIKRL